MTKHLSHWLLAGVFNDDFIQNLCSKPAHTGV